MISPADLDAELAGFCGSEQCCSVNRQLFPFVWMTEGVKHLAEKAECFWLIEAIASHQLRPEVSEKKRGERFTSFHLWNLVRKDGGAVLEARADTNDPVVVKQEIEYTDFPFNSEGKFKLFVGLTEVGGKTGYMVMLPSEY